MQIFQRLMCWVLHDDSGCPRVAIDVHQLLLMFRNPYLFVLDEGLLEDLASVSRPNIALGRSDRISLMLLLF